MVLTNLLCEAILNEKRLEIGSLVRCRRRMRSWTPPYRCTSENPRYVALSHLQVALVSDPGLLAVACARLAPEVSRSQWGNGGNKFQCLFTLEIFWTPFGDLRRVQYLNDLNDLISPLLHFWRNLGNMLYGRMVLTYLCLSASVVKCIYPVAACWLRRFCAPSLP